MTSEGPGDKPKLISAAADEPAIVDGDPLTSKDAKDMLAQAA